MPTKKELVEVERARRLAGGSGKCFPRMLMFHEPHMYHIKVEEEEELQWVD